MFNTISVRRLAPVICAGLCLVSAGLATAAEAPRGGLSGVAQMFQDNCAVCHGEHMQGAPQGSPLIGQTLLHGASNAELVSSISLGFPAKGMPAWQKILNPEEIKSLALWIAENRDGLVYSDFKISSELHLPAAAQQTQLANFKVQPLISGLDPLPYSIALLPDGNILLTEKMRGLRVISARGEASDLIQGTPRTYDDYRNRAGPERLLYGMGWLFDVAPHPDYASNGWIYLHYSDRCEDCNELSRQHNQPVSMNVLERGRIRDGHWVDRQVLWHPQVSTYSTMTDVAAGGRIAFDPDGYVFISVGMKNSESTQDLAWPGGKIHRLHDDGRIPADNPFVDHPTALKSIWSYGHRSPQGLEFNAKTRQLWGTEHGPRGGDEINLLVPGGNYGWPMYSKGQNYDGTEVATGRLQSEVEFQDIVQPVVDWTPSPAVSSFVFYSGAAFPAWQDQMLVGSLKAADLYRVNIRDTQLIEQEKLLEDLARIRDIEVDAAGIVYLLLEHASGGQIVKLMPAGAPTTAGLSPR